MLSQLPKSAQYLYQHQYFQSAFKSIFKKWQRSHYLNLQYLVAFGLARLFSVVYYQLWQYELRNE